MYICISCIISLYGKQRCLIKVQILLRSIYYTLPSRNIIMNYIISYLVSKLVRGKPENHKLAGEFVDQLVHHRVVPLGGVSEGSHIHHQNHLPLILLEVNFFSFQSFRRKLQKIVNSDRALDACHV